MKVINCIVICISIILTASCGQKDEKYNSSKHQMGVEFLNNQQWDQAITIYSELSESDPKYINYLGYAYAGCAKFNAYDFYKLVDFMSQDKVFEDETILNNLQDVYSKIPELNNREQECLDLAVQLYPYYENRELIVKELELNFQWSALRIYRFLYRIKEFAKYTQNLSINKGVDKKLKTLGEELNKKIYNLIDDGFISYILMKYSYPRMYEYSKEYKEVIVNLFENKQIDFTVNSQAYKTKNFINDILTSNPEFIGIIFWEFISNLDNDTLRVLMNKKLSSENIDKIKILFKNILISNESEQIDEIKLKNSTIVSLFINSYKNNKPKLFWEELEKDKNYQEILYLVENIDIDNKKDEILNEQVNVIYNSLDSLYHQSKNY